MTKSVRAALNKAKAESWIKGITEAASRSGRSNDNFITPPAKQFGKAAILGLNQRGIRIYSGSGEVFLVDTNGDSPRIVQRRPLAQRFIKLQDGGSA